MQDMSSLSMEEVIKINLAPQCLPLTSVSESILSVNAKLGSSVHFLSRMAPVQVPIAQVCASCTKVAITTPFPFGEKTGGPCCHH